MSFCLRQTPGEGAKSEPESVTVGKSESSISDAGTAKIDGILTSSHKYLPTSWVNELSRPAACLEKRLYSRASKISSRSCRDIEDCGEIGPNVRVRCQCSDLSAEAASMMNQRLKVCEACSLTWVALKQAVYCPCFHATDGKIQYVSENYCQHKGRCEQPRRPMVTMG